MNFGEIIVFPNMTMDTGDMIKKPNIDWNADPSALYTLLIEDVDIESQPFWYAHWLVTNIPGMRTGWSPIYQVCALAGHQYSRYAAQNKNLEKGVKWTIKKI